VDASLRVKVNGSELGESGMDSVYMGVTVVDFLLGVMLKDMLLGMSEIDLLPGVLGIFDVLL